MNWRKILKWTFRIIGSILLLGLITILILIYTYKLRISDEGAIEEMSNAQTEVEIHYLEKHERKMRGTLAKKGNKNLLVLLHGSPSSGAQWVALVNDSTLSSKVDFLVIDRPGYGMSSYGNPLISVEKVADMVNDHVALHKEEYENVILLGTSYGGTVAARMLMDFPGAYASAILISSSLAPEEERTYPISYFMDRYRWLFPEFFIVANDEKLTHSAQLRLMEPHWSKIIDPVYFIHSTTDDLVYPANVDFALEKLDSTVQTTVHWVPNASHSMYWSARDVFFQKVNEFVDAIITDSQEQ